MHFIGVSFHRFQCQNVTQCTDDFQRTRRCIIKCVELIYLTYIKRTGFCFYFWFWCCWVHCEDVTMEQSQTIHKKRHCMLITVLFTERQSKYQHSKHSIRLNTLGRHKGNEREREHLAFYIYLFTFRSLLASTLSKWQIGGKTLWPIESLIQSVHFKMDMDG